MNLLGKLSWDAIPLDQPIALVTGLVVIIVLLIMSYRGRCDPCITAFDWLSQLPAIGGNVRPML